MNKSILGLLALTSVVSLAGKYEHFHGYINHASSFGVKNEKLEYEDSDYTLKNLLDKKDRNTDLNGLLEIGGFFHKDKDLYVFAGVKDFGLGFKVDEEKKNGNPALNSYKQELVKPSYYFGARWDSKIEDNWNILLTFAHKHNEGIKEEETFDKPVHLEYDKDEELSPLLENAVRRHLKEKGKDSEQKVKDLLYEGYALKDGNYNTLMSAVLKGKVKDIKLSLGTVYNTKDFSYKGHNLITFVKADGNLKENVKLESLVKHEIDNETIDHYGKLNAEAKFVSTVNDVDFKNKLGFELKNIKAEQEIKAFTENSIIFKGTKNTELEIGANYVAEAKVNDKELKHKPKAILNLSYDNKKVLASTKNSNEVEIKHKYEKTTTKENNNDDKVEIKNTFKTYNNLGYKSKHVGLGLEANYILDAKLKPKKDFTHKALFSPEINGKYTNDEETMNYKGKLNVAYLLNATTTDEKLKVYDKYHDLFFNLRNELGYSLSENTKLKANLDAYSVATFMISEDKVDPTAEIIVNPKLEVENKNGKYTNRLKADLKYFASILKDDKPIIEHKLGLKAGVESEYAALENVNVIFGMDAEYGYKGYLKNYVDATMKYINEKGKTKNGYASSFEMNEFYKDKLSKKEQVDLLKELVDSDSYVHKLELKPKIEAKITYLDGKLEIGPKIEGKIVLREDEKLEETNSVSTTNNKHIFLMREIGTTLSLNVKYSW